MAKRRAAYRKTHHNRFSMFLVVLIVLMIMVVVSMKSVELKQKLEVYTAKQDQLTILIEEEKARTDEIAEYRKYTQTKKYVEEVAKDKLGLVYKDEILFKEEN